MATSAEDVRTFARQYGCAANLIEEVTRRVLVDRTCRIADGLFEIWNRGRTSYDSSERKDK